jgi:hypothetical protein
MDKYLECFFKALKIKWKWVSIKRIVSGYLKRFMYFLPPKPGTLREIFEIFPESPGWVF